MKDVKLKTPALLAKCSEIFSVTQYKVTDYSAFAKFPGNRDAESNGKHLAKTITSMERITEINPLIGFERDKKIYLKDGQSRCIAGKLQKCGVWVRLVPDDKSDAEHLQDIFDINNNSHSWKIQQYIDGKVEQGHPAFTYFKALQADYPNLDTAMLLKEFGTSKGKIKIGTSAPTCVKLPADTIRRLDAFNTLIEYSLVIGVSRKKQASHRVFYNEFMKNTTAKNRSYIKLIAKYELCMDRIALGTYGTDETCCRLVEGFKK